MMDISDLTDQAKSVLLAKARGWYQVDEEPIMGARWQEPGKPNNYWINPPNLYITTSMALAWRVHLWGLQATFWTEYYRWWRSPKDRPYIHAEAQRLWLDKILKLAIAAGLVEIEATRSQP